MFKPVLSFKARIKKGAAIFHDHGYFRWPGCRNIEAADPNTEFDCEMFDANHFELTAKRFGKLKGATGDYGNGAICVSHISDLDVADSDLARVAEYCRAETRTKLDAAIAEVIRLEKEIAGLPSSPVFVEGAVMTDKNGGINQ